MKKVTTFLAENWFKIAILVFLVLFLAKLDEFEEVVKNKDNGLSGVNQYYKAKLCDEGIGGALSELECLDF